MSFLRLKVRISPHACSQLSVHRWRPRAAPPPASSRIPGQMRLASMIPHSEVESGSATPTSATPHWRGPRRRTADIDARGTPGRVSSGSSVFRLLLQPRLRAASISGRCHQRHRHGAVVVGNLNKQVKTASCTIMVAMSLQLDRRDRCHYY